MNIALINSYINEFNREVIDSGFVRDLGDYVESIAANSDNIVALRGMANDIKRYLENVYSGDLSKHLKFLIPEDVGTPFTEGDHLQTFIDLMGDPSIAQEQFHDRLLAALTSLSEEIESNVEAVVALDKFLKPYAAKGSVDISSDGDAVLALIFNDDLTAHSLSHLAKSLTSWNRILPIYYQLLKEDSPQDVRVVGVESGSIDLIINVDLDVSLNLVEAFKVGVKAFGAYLAYKKGLAPFIDTYVKRRLLELEEEKDRLLLENIGDAVSAKIADQHEQARKLLPGVSGEAKDKKIEQVAKLFTSHIVKGNDVKLLALPADSPVLLKEKSAGEAEELRKLSAETRRLLPEIGGSVRQELLSMYGPSDDESGLVPEGGAESASGAVTTKKAAKKAARKANTGEA